MPPLHPTTESLLKSRQVSHMEGSNLDYCTKFSNYLKYCLGKQMVIVLKRNPWAFPFQTLV